MTCPQCATYIEWLRKERYNGEIPSSTYSSITHRLRRLHEKALPGNWAWNELENFFGHDGDYQPSDQGEAPYTPGDYGEPTGEVDPELTLAYDH